MLTELREVNENFFELQINHSIHELIGFKRAFNSCLVAIFFKTFFHADSTREKCMQFHEFSIAQTISFESSTVLNGQWFALKSIRHAASRPFDVFYRLKINESLFCLHGSLSGVKASLAAFHSFSFSDKFLKIKLIINAVKWTAE